MSERLLPVNEVARMVGLTAPTIWRLRKAGRFPHPLKISPGQSGATRWRLSEVEAWIESRARAS
jgi:prophage regulatory protein